MGAILPGAAARRRADARRTSLPPWAFAAGIAALAAVGVAARILIWLSPYGVPEADEATGGLMARHLFSGDFSVFFWGQGYGGPVEAVLAAPLLAVFGDTWVALRIVPIGLTALTALTVWRVGLRTVGAYAAPTAAAVYWSFPPYLLWMSIHFKFFYASQMLFCALTLLLVLRLYERPLPRDMLALGLVVGLGLWQSFQLATVIPVAVAWLLLRRPRLVRLVPYALPGIAAGAAPVLVYNLRHSWRSLHLGEIGISSTYTSRVGTFFTHTLPMSLAVRQPCTEHWLVAPIIGIGVFALLLAGFVVLAWHSWGTPRELIVVTAALFPLIYAVDQLTGTFVTPMYVVVLMPVLALAACAGVARPAQGLSVAAAALLLVAASFADLEANAAGGRPVAGCLAKGSYLPRDFRPLEHELGRLGISRFYADYWIGYRVAFETDERLIGADGRANALRVSRAGGVIPKPHDESLQPRHPEYQKLVGRVAKAPWVIDLDYDTAGLDASAFREAHYRSHDVGRFRIYWAGRGSAAQ